jgi:ribosome-associated protein
LNSTTSTIAPALEAERLAIVCAEAAADKKAEGIMALDMRGLSNVADYFVICSGTSEPHLKAIANEIQDRLQKEHGIRPNHVDGYPMSQWVVVDFYDVLVHIFHQEKRAFYSLEDLWSDAPRLRLPNIAPAPELAPAAPTEMTAA